MRREIPMNPPVRPTEIDDEFVYYDFLTDAEIAFIRTEGANALARASFDQAGDGLLGCETAPYQDTCLTGGTALGEVTNLLLSHDPGTGRTTLTWSAVAGVGIGYDTLQSTVSDGFMGATCAETLGADTQAVTSATPSAGNTCGSGSLGGVREARQCHRRNGSGQRSICRKRYGPQVEMRPVRGKFRPGGTVRPPGGNRNEHWIQEPADPGLLSGLPDRL